MTFWIITIVLVLVIGGLAWTDYNEKKDQE